VGDEAEYLGHQHDYSLKSSERHYKDTRKPNQKGLYQCTFCKKYKPKSEFYKDRRVPCGIRNRCKECYHKKVG